MIGPAVVSLLKANPGVAAITTRIYPSVMPSGAVLPALVYSYVGGVSFASLDGPSGTDQQRIQIDHYAQDEGQLGALVRAVRAALDGYRGTVVLSFGTYRLAISSPEEGNSFTETTVSPPLRRFQRDYIVTYSAVP